MSERAMTPEQVAQLWDVSASHVRREIAAGRLQAFRVGGKLLRIKPSAVEAYECSNTNSSASEVDGPSPSMTEDAASAVASLGRVMQLRRQRSSAK